MKKQDGTFLLSSPSQQDFFLQGMPENGMPFFHDATIHVMEKKHYRYDSCPEAVHPVFADIPDCMTIDRFRTYQAPEYFLFSLHN